MYIYVYILMVVSILYLLNTTEQKWPREQKGPRLIKEVLNSLINQLIKQRINEFNN